MAEENNPKGNVNIDYNNANTGLNQDNTLNQVKKGSLTYALNAVVENYDGNSVNYQNEPGNTSCIEFPKGYVLVGKHFIPEKNKQIFLLANPENGGSQIGYMQNNDCIYNVIGCSDCLEFDINNPVHKIVHKVSRYGTEIYWATKKGRFYLDIDNPPRPLLSGSNLCDPKYKDKGCEIDCTKLKMQPNFTIPLINVTEVISGGENTAGTVQFYVQYADANSNPFTSYYGRTNPTPIADNNKVTVNFNYVVGKSIVLDIDNLDVTGQFEYFNLAVIKTVNGISTPELVGTYFIDRESIQITYSGQNKTQIQLSIEDIFEKFPFYDSADYVTTVQDILVWSGLTAAKRINYQEIASNIVVNWQTNKIPAGKDYSDEILATNSRGYLRDEVYALEFQPLLASGQEVDGFHIPGKEMNAFEIGADPVYPTDPDFIGNVDNGQDFASYWKIYNTATVAGQYDLSNEENYEGPFQFGEMAYWESSEEYPCNKEIWGKLSGKKIRHHKFPDELVSPMFDSAPFPGKNNLIKEDRAIFPMGIFIDPVQIKELINNSSLSQEEKDDIVGYRILRGDRGVNKSIVAKGMLRNVNSYKRDTQTYYYPNYPYNDVKKDPFLNSVNNAWTNECNVFVVTISTIPPGGKAYVQYVDCNNNKAATIDYSLTGTYELCSIDPPKIISKDGSIATGEVTSTKYDVWEAYIEHGTLTFCGGFTVYWTDPAGVEQNEFIRGWGPNQGTIVTMFVKQGTSPKPEPSSNTCGKRINFLRTVDLETTSNCKEETPLPGTDEKENLQYRQIFNSPETSFGQPFLGNILKLESVLYGGGKAHFVEVKKNAKYKLLTKEAQHDALTSSQELARMTSPFNYGAMFTAYQAYLEIYVNGITRKNYSYSFNSIASYNYSNPVLNNIGFKQRNLDIKKYLIPGVQNVGEEDITINNYNRETSVYLRTAGSKENDIPALPLPHLSTEMLSTGLIENSRFTISGIGNCSMPGKEEPIEVVSYYASLKNDFINQWGQIYSYSTIDTGYTVIFGKESLTQKTIFGGDTFIGKFAYKTKVPFFVDNRVGAPDDSDIFYDEIGNIAYPKYWHSARSILNDFPDIDLLTSPVASVEMNNIISHKAHVFDCPNSQELLSATSKPSDSFGRTFYDGYMYQFAYGVPSFYCESSYNLDLRTAFNDREGDFWPHVSSGIPDEWVQETNVSILNDNTYNYNTTFSKQNKENYITHLPEDWSLDYLDTSYPFRAIYSDIQNTDADNKVNSWLTYRALSYFDFPQNFGLLTALDGLANKAILARFENKSLLYNHLVTIDTSNPQAAYVGNPKLFSNPPIDYADTDLGYIGSQHKMLLKIPQGAVFADSKRGQIFLVNGTESNELTGFGSGMNRFFTNYLAFEINEYFPEVDNDNHFNGIGLHGVYDAVYQRIIITKLDYVPLDRNIWFDAEVNKFYLKMASGYNFEVFVTDQDYFCNKSFTVSFNFNTKSWISFHSYLPNWYVGENKYFYSGVNYCPNDFDVLVGKMLPEFKTTTTSTTRKIMPTTTTTTTLYLSDCTIEGEVTRSMCEIEGVGIIIYTPEICKRPDNMLGYVFVLGYTLQSPAISETTTGSALAACSNLSYYNFYNGNNANNNYAPISENVEVLSLDIGSDVYILNGTNDCTVIEDGWYFVQETTNESKIYNVLNGKIIEIDVCQEAPATTTTTTTLAYQTLCFVGLYVENDTLHPLGGRITYLNKFGDELYVIDLFAPNTVEIEASMIISKIGVYSCN